MNKKYIVRLSDEERGLCQDIVKRLKGTSEKVKRAQILLRADADGPGWSDAKIAEALKASDKTDHLRVNVSGDVQGDTIKVSSVKLL